MTIARCPKCGTPCQKCNHSNNGENVPSLTCIHEHTIMQKGDETLCSRVGCLDCNAWLDPVRLKKP